MSRQVSYIKVILTDTIAFSSWLLPVLTIGLILFIITPKNLAEISLDLLMIIGMILFFSIALVAWRISIFAAIYHDGLETTATITNILSYRGSGWIGYEYSYLGEKFKSGAGVLMTKRVRKYRMGDEVVVLIDRGKPKRAFLRDLYLA